MTVLKVLLILLLIFFLIGWIRVGGDVEYSADGVLAHARVGGLRFQVYPRKKPKKETAERKAKKKPKPEKEPAPEETPPKKGGSLAMVKEMLPVIGEAAGSLRLRIRIDRLFLDFTAGGRDAAGAAMAYGYSSAAVGTIMPVFQNNFDLKEYRVRTGVDFNAQAPAVYANAGISARIGQLLSFAVLFGWKLLRIYRRHKKQTNLKKEANRHG